MFELVFSLILDGLYIEDRTLAEKKTQRNCWALHVTKKKEHFLRTSVSFKNWFQVKSDFKCQQPKDQRPGKLHVILVA